MTEVQKLYEDQWGSIWTNGSIVGIDWLPTTLDMVAADFQQFLMTFADKIVETNGRLAFVDVQPFRMDPAHMDGEWRDANIIPRYNEAGIKKFAFVMPQSMPLIGQQPTAEPPSVFLTGYFASREDALNWLADTVE